MKNIFLNKIAFLLLMVLILVLTMSQTQVTNSKSYKTNHKYTKQQVDSFWKSKNSESLLNKDSIIGFSKVTLTKVQPECNMGNYIVDAQLLAAKKIDPKVQLSLTNQGSIKALFIPKGELKVSDIYELMPFDNKLVLLEIPGSVLDSLCQIIANNKGWPISGFTFEIKNNKAFNIQINGKVLNHQYMYQIAISDYLAKGGNNCEILKSFKRKYTNLSIRNILIDQIANDTKLEGGIMPKIENRIRYVY